MTINVAIVDDHNVVREGIKQLLEIDGEIKVIGEAKDGYECMEMLKHTVPDVLLLDINMPNMAITTTNSIRVNPLLSFIRFLILHLFIYFPPIFITFLWYLSNQTLVKSWLL